MTLTLVHLGDVAEIIMGQSPDGANYNFDGRGLPLVTGAGQFGDKYPRPLQFSTAGSKVSRAGDIIICIRATIGDLNWSDREYYLGRGVAVIRSGAELHPEYTWRAVHWKKKLLESRATGSTFKQVKREDLEKLELPLPSLPEQRRIAAILDKADELRAKRYDSISKVQEMIKAQFIEIFGDPVGNSKGWEVKKLVEVGTVDRGVSKHRPRNAPHLLGGRYPLVQTGDVANSHGYIRNFTSTYSEAGLLQSKMWPKGTLCSRFHQYLGKIELLKRSLQDSQTQMDELFDSLQHRAFRGEL
ncbi:restriction endonuclease subunit S [bacterium]|nr:restriction endonuclease subunit S [bacterium]